MKHKWLTIISLAYCIAVIILDIFTPLGLAVGYFYLPLLFIMAYKGKPQLLHWCFLTVVSLTIVGGTFSYFSSTLIQPEIWMTNRIFAIVLMILAYLLLKSGLAKVGQLQEEKVVIDNIIESIGIEIVSINIKTQEATHLRGGEQFNLFSIEKNQSLSNFCEYLGPSNGKQFGILLNTLSKEQNYFEFESELLQVHTNEHWYRIQGFRIMPGVYNCIVQDVSLRGDSEYGKRNLNAVLDILPCFVWTTSASGEIELINRNLIDTLQYSKEEIKHNWQNLIHPDDKKDLLTKWSDALKERKQFSAEYRFKCQDGKYTHTVVEVAPIFDDKGRLIKWLGSGIDISAMQELRRQRQVLNGIAKATQDSAMVFKLEDDSNTYRISYINRAFESITGYTLEDTYHKDPIELLHATPLGVYDKKRFQLSKDKTDLSGEGEIITKSGKRTIVDFYTFAIDTDSSSFLCILEDKTKEKRLDSIIARNKRMDSIGHLSGGIAHDFNNLLAVISGNLELIKLESNNSNVLGYVSTAMESANQGAKLTSSLLQFARGNDEETKDVCCVSKVLNEQRQLFPSVAGPDVKLIVKAAPNLYASINEVQFESVIINLISNAKGALLTQADGVISIMAEEYYLTEQRAREINAKIGQYVRVEVSDNGTGMSEEQLENIFSPFYSTKSKLKGTGLGLSMIYAYVRQSGGVIDVRSKLGKGSTFEILLNLVEPTFSVDVAEVRDVPYTNFDNKTVLLVEDKHRVAEIAKRHLTSFGFNVIYYSSAAQAVNHLSGDEVIDLIFTDISMPGDLDGYGMVQTLTEKFGHIPVIFVSGFFGHDEQLMEENGHIKMKKPYTRDCLAEALNKVMR